MVDSVSPDDQETEHSNFSPEEMALFSFADLGMKASQFRDSEVGRLMIGFALQEIRDHGEKLLDCDAEDTKKIRHHQQKAGAARLFLVFLEEAISSGEVAYEQLTQTEV